MKACSQCGQVNIGQTGEHPCPDCGLPIIWDGDYIFKVTCASHHDGKDAEMKYSGAYSDKDPAELWWTCPKCGVSVFLHVPLALYNLISFGLEE